MSNLNNTLLLGPPQNGTAFRCDTPIRISRLDLNNTARRFRGDNVKKMTCLPPPKKSTGTNCERNTSIFLPDKFGADWLWNANRFSAARVEQLSGKTKNTTCVRPLFSFFRRTEWPDRTGTNGCSVVWCRWTPRRYVDGSGKAEQSYGIVIRNPLRFHSQVRVLPWTPFVKALVRWATGGRLAHSPTQNNNMLCCVRHEQKVIIRIDLAGEAQHLRGPNPPFFPWNGTSDRE